MGLARVSVIIPVGRHGAVVGEAIASALDQTLSPTEILVIDDGGDPPLATTVSDPRVRYLRLPTNLGPSAARNRGVRAAVGDWIAFLDADDLWDREKLALQIADRDAATPVLLASNVMVEADTMSVPHNRSVPSADLDDWILVERQSLQTSSLVLPRETALLFPFDEALRLYEDWDLVLRIAKGGVPIVYTPECLGRYRRLSKVSAPSRTQLARRAAWLLDPASPARIGSRYHHYLVSVFRAQARQDFVAAVRNVVTLAAQTSRPIRATVAALRLAWRRRMDARS